MTEREWYRVAMVTFVEALGVDERDAASGAMIAFTQNMKPGSTIQMAHNNPELNGSEVRIYEHIEAGIAAGNGYLWQRPTSKAFREYSMPWQKDTEGDD